jgi:hypothetical protein
LKKKYHQILRDLLLSASTLTSRRSPLAGATGHHNLVSDSGVLGVDSLPRVPASIVATAPPPKPSAQTKILLEVMTNKERDDVDRWDRVMALTAVSEVQPLWVQEVTNSYVTDSASQSLLARLCVHSLDEQGYSLPRSHQEGQFDLGWPKFCSQDEVGGSIA